MRWHSCASGIPVKRLVVEAFGGIYSEWIGRKIYKPASGDKFDVTTKGRHGMVATRQAARGGSTRDAQTDDGNGNLRRRQAVQFSCSTARCVASVAANGTARAGAMFQSQAGDGPAVFVDATRPYGG